MSAAFCLATLEGSPSEVGCARVVGVGFRLLKIGDCTMPIDSNACR